MRVIGRIKHVISSVARCGSSLIFVAEWACTCRPVSLSITCIAAVSALEAWFFLPVWYFSIHLLWRGHRIADFFLSNFGEASWWPHYNETAARVLTFVTEYGCSSDYLLVRLWLICFCIYLRYCRWSLMCDEFKSMCFIKIASLFKGRRCWRVE